MEEFCDLDDTINDNNQLQEIILFSDGCCYQNRNITLSNTLLRFAWKYNVKIVQKYLEKGHTQMEVDAMHSKIERKLKNVPIYSPANYVECFKNARPSQPYELKYVQHDFFQGLWVYEVVWEYQTRISSRWPSSYRYTMSALQSKWEYRI